MIKSFNHPSELFAAEKPKKVKHTLIKPKDKARGPTEAHWTETGLDENEKPHLTETGLKKEETQLRLRVYQKNTFSKIK